MAVFLFEVCSSDRKGLFTENCSLCFNGRTTRIVIVWQCARPSCTPSSLFSLFMDDGSQAGHVEHRRSRHVLAVLPSQIGRSCVFMHMVIVANNQAHA